MELSPGRICRKEVWLTKSARSLVFLCRVVHLKDQSYFYIDEDDKYVYVLVFYYYSYRDFVKAMYQNIPYEKIKDPKKY